MVSKKVHFSSYKRYLHISYEVETSSQGLQSITVRLRGDGTLADQDFRSGKGPVTAMKFAPVSFDILFQLS